MTIDDGILITKQSSAELSTPGNICLGNGQATFQIGTLLQIGVMVVLQVRTQCSERTKRS